jgi:hypothetical protein
LDESRRFKNTVLCRVDTRGAPELAAGCHLPLQAAGLALFMFHPQNSLASCSLWVLCKLPKARQTVRQKPCTKRWDSSQRMAAF